GVEPMVAAADRTVYLMQRKDTPVGRGLGKTTGWTHRLTLGRRGVKMMNGVEYLKVDDAGLHIRIGGEVEVLDVDNVIVCAGQTPSRQLYDELVELGLEASLIGGAFDASALDAKRAINQACHLAAAV
ncbi:MAG: FAD-dependent oxidoreductase, partial [Alphaproteobacteria bacterium]|nr:FAD-dependent oxidoreductase [Alphaproteobacteria bacterium]